MSRNAPEPRKNGGRDSPTRSTCWRATARRRSATCATIADTKLGDFATPIAKAQIAAALAMLGDRDRAERAYRRRARCARAAAEAGARRRPRRLRLATARRRGVGDACLRGQARRRRRSTTPCSASMPRARTSHATSTQEDAWLVLAARALAKKPAAISLDDRWRGAAGRALPHASTPLSSTTPRDGRQCRRRHGAGGGFGLRRAGEARARGRAGLQDRAQVTTRSPARPPIRRRAKQNDRFVVVLTMTEPQPQFGRVIVADYLPAGFEIDNPHLVSSGETGTLSWIANAVEPVHSEFRDDRFVAAFDRNARSPPVFTVAYVVRAVSPGTLRAAAGQGRGHVPARPLRPHRRPARSR